LRALRPSPPPCPYTTLFRSLQRARDRARRVVQPEPPSPLSAPRLHCPARSAVFAVVLPAIDRLPRGRRRCSQIVEEGAHVADERSEEHTSELQSRVDPVCRL